MRVVTGLRTAEPGRLAPVHGPDVAIAALPNDPHRHRAPQGSVTPGRCKIELLRGADAVQLLARPDARHGRTMTSIASRSLIAPYSSGTSLGSCSHASTEARARAHALYGGNRRVPGLPREEVALLADVSVTTPDSNGAARPVCRRATSPTTSGRRQREARRSGHDARRTKTTLAADPSLMLFAYTAAPGTRSAEALDLLASWAATPEAAETAPAPTDA